MFKIRQDLFPYIRWEAGIHNALNGRLGPAQRFWVFFRFVLVEFGQLNVRVDFSAICSFFP